MTSDNPRVVDFEARQTALDIAQSIAVQAPAGSGKTELLSLRFLKLLAVSKHPEEVLAITFTKKAANEMSERILNALSWAETVSPDELGGQLEKDRYRIARSVLEQDEKEGWQLQQSPNRLRIQTIDSFCNFLASRLPILSNFGGPLAIGEDVDDCYQLAIRNCLKLLDSEHGISAAIAELMLHFDNDTTKIETLLTSLLQQREQWIADIVGVASSPEQAFELLTDNLLELVEESLTKARSLLQPYEASLMPLLQFAVNNLRDAEAESAILACEGLDRLPGTSFSDLPQWTGLTQLLFVKTGTAFRKDVRKGEGFPPQSGSAEQKALLKEKKEQMKELLAAMAESRDLLHALDYLRKLPLPEDDEASWEFLNTLTAILPTLMAQLELAFAQKNKVDYPQVSLAALRALGSEDKPTDLALSLDYQIKHILVDEFQDTSSSQMDLLAKLTAGWEPQDGRTLFVVGDAMQSCYGFRNANVGLFIKLRQSGLGHITMHPIDLQANFRSDKGVVDWVNGVFDAAFPARDDISRGAVKYSHSHAVHPTDLEAAVSGRIYQYGEGSKFEAQVEEAFFIAEEVSRLRSQHPDRSIAILVRSRGLLTHILPALREAEVPWLATEIDSLNALPLITDLLSLTSALCNEADRLAWLSLLRAPWCGLSLKDLHIVANWKDNLSVYESLRQLSKSGDEGPLSEDGLRRVISISGVMEKALSSKMRCRISRVLRSTFGQLGGARIIRSIAEQESVERFFEILLRSELAGSLQNIGDFKTKVAKSFVSSPAQAENNPVQIMTIHKSKGLEFDHVFLPGLASPGRPDDKPLLLWHQRINHLGQNKLFLATLSATGSDDHDLYNLLRYEKAEKARLERARLLYIGITRAMKSVYLSATLADKDGEAVPPASASLLATLWESLLENGEHARDLSFIPVDAVSKSLPQQDLLSQPPAITRLAASNFESISANDDATDSVAAEATDIEADGEEATELSTENQMQIEVGNLVHEALQNLLTNKRSMGDDDYNDLKTYWRRRLQLFGFSDEQIAQSIHSIELSLRNSLESEELGWIFDSGLENSEAELAMQTHSNGFVHTHVIDRTFIDADGIRWIIDYKSSSPAAGQSLNDFLTEQVALYEGQLARYRGLFAAEENKGIKTALLFTSLPQLVECG